ncbi:hypothetical protein ACFLT9_01300 [Acidobacteriota bacterium]
MKYIKVIFSLLILGSFLFAAQGNDLEIWEEFVNLLENKKMTVEKIKGEYAADEQLLEWITGIKSRNDMEEMILEPEVFRVENKVHFLKSLKGENSEVNYLFSFIIVDGQWYFNHLEAIFIRLDKIGALPTMVFPDIPENQKTWARNEIRVSKMIQLWTFLTKGRGKEDAFNYFKDGPGFFVGAKTWVPFVPPAKAFILYLCWYQANLYGNPVALTKLEDNKAVVEMQPLYFLLYRRASHIKPQISFEDYRTLFETIWIDRAETAGWKLTITYQKDDICTFTFKR